MTNKQNQTENVFNFKRTLLSVLTIYIIVVVGFYYLAEDQIRYRESRGNIEMPIAENGIVELTEGTIVEQVFVPWIQRLESVSVQFGTYYRNNSGTVTIELSREDTNELLMNGSFSASQIEEGQILTISSIKPIESVATKTLILRITADSSPGEAVVPLSCKKEQGNGILRVNGETVDGSLCFSAYGTDYVWTGLHYWKLAFMFGLVLILSLNVILIRWSKGKRSYIISAIIEIKKYKFLIRQLVSRDFKTKYKRSVLGVFWSFLNPLMMMTVQYIVFSTLFKSDIPDFAAYLIIGTVMFNFFSESCSMTLTSILGNSGLITKVYMPKYIYPLTRTLSSMVNLFISIIPMMIVCIVTGVELHKSMVLSLYFFICLVVFCLGMGLLLATSMVFFRDTQFLWGVISMIWMYATPIFYPESIVPETIRKVIFLNPLYHFIKNARICLIDGISPEPRAYVLCLCISLGMLFIGAFIFCKKQDEFVLYV